MSTRPPLPSFTHETAVLKVRLAEDGWNSRDPEASMFPSWKRDKSQPAIRSNGLLAMSVALP
jgi:nuclear transport factor 2 (NTF2) superfamily protein